MGSADLNPSKIERSLTALGNELKKLKIVGELIICGGAVMLLEYNSRNTTKDIDGIYSPSTEMKELIRKIAHKHELPEDWLNDSVKYSKSYIRDLRTNSKFHRRYGNLVVYKADIEQMIAMKLVAFRLGQSHDLIDLEVLMQKYSASMGKITPDVLKNLVIKYYGNLEILKMEALVFIEGLNDYA